ncbi:hypothetical protein ABRP17_017165 [Stenotrophomonas sp. WHRI 8082]|uniref:hypothetical protein n=1 Tax=Stenotrophomonas sp. WHRI 8082 TaxID=3162571 RepID=UPI0032EBFAD8
MGPFNRPDRLRWQAASVLAAAPIAALAAGDVPAPPLDAPVHASPAALVADLHRRLLAGQSATATLEAWCAEHGLADTPRVRAVRVRGVQRDAPVEVRSALAINDATPLRYRRVQLTCGQRVLSEADNWYVPSLLTAAMNHALDSSDEPFGRVVAPLDFKRQTLHDREFWPPRVDGARATVLEVRALLRDGQRRPFSYVVENYQQEILPRQTPAPGGTAPHR